MPSRRFTALLSSVILTVMLIAPAAAAPGDDPLAIPTSPYAAIAEALDAISALTVDAIDARTLSEAAIRAITEATGDRYTRYLPPDELTSFIADVEGGYFGIGVTVEQGTITVVRPGGPAEQAGIVGGDELISIDGRLVSGLDLQTIRDSLRGVEGTTVRLAVRRRGVEITFTVTRAWIKLDTVFPRIIRGAEYGIGHNIGYLRIGEFSATTPADVAAAIQTFRDANAIEQIIDLRDNPGGLVGAATAIADLFIDGEKPMVHLYGRAVPGGTVMSSPGGKSGRTIVLVNRNTASAAEILAAALKESADATLVGESTFGKGRFQYSVPLSNGGAVNVTAGYFLTPNGNGIDGKGVAPDIAIADPRFRQLPETPLNPRRQLKQGMVGLDVLALEEQLRFLGYAVGEVDGVFDAKLTSALKAFEKAAGLKVDGTASIDDQLAALAARPIPPATDPIYEAGLRCALGR